MIRRPPRSTQSRSSAASDVYKRQIVDVVLLALLSSTAVAILMMRHLFAVVALTGAFSLLSAGLLVTLDAVDVAFTEAAVGAGISTVLMLGTLALTRRRESRPPRLSPMGLVVIAVTGGALIYATPDMPKFGDPNAPSHKHICLLYTSPSPRDRTRSRMPSSA